MKIRSQFIISTAIFGLVILIVIASVIITNQQLEQIETQQQISANIESGSDQLNTLTSQYFLYQQPQQLTSWQSTSSAILGNFSNLNPSTAGQKTIVNNLSDDLSRLNSSFTDLVSYLETAPRNVSIRVLPEFQNSWNSIVTAHQTLGFDASHLSESLRIQADQQSQTNLILVIALSGVFGAFFLISYLITYRRTLKSISCLQDGIKIIGSGNLDYSIQTKREDEIGELSKAFNEMATNLKTVIASKTDLENEIVGRKQADTLLRESEQRWATTLASIGDAVIATDTLGNIMFMNDKAQDLTGWVLSDAFQKPAKAIFNIVNEQTRLEVENPIEKVLREGIVVGLANHTVLIRKDGSEVPIDDSGAPIKDPEGKTTGVVLVFRDITERKKAEDSLKEATNQLELQIKRMPIGCIVWDKDFKVISWNPAAETIFGYSEKDIIGKHPYGTIVPKEAQPTVEKIWRRLLQGDDTANNINDNLTKDGKLITCLWSNTPLKREDGSVIGVLSMVQDITERKKAEENILNSEKRLNLSQEIAHVGSWELDLVKDQLSWSDEVYRIFGLKPQEFAATYEAFLHAVYQDDRKAVDDAYSGSLREGRDTYEIEHRVVRRSTGEIRIVYEKCVHIRDGTGKIIRSVGMVQDITDRKMMEDKIEKYSKHLENLVEERTKQLKDSERLVAIGATAGMVGHDIRNPLQAITGDLYLVKTELEEISDSEQKKNALESLDEIQNNIDYINKIVADLQDYARPLNPRAQETNIKSLLNEIVIKNGIPKNIKLTIEVEEKAETILADPDYIKRIFSNLTLNAVQAMPTGGKLTIHAFADKQTNDVIITVKDTGVGIPENIKPKLFTPMMTTKSKGQGFGLAVVKRMTEGLGGTVTFESEEGKGTTFILRLRPPKK